MSLLPEPNSIIEQMLLWVRIPIGLIMVIISALTALDYLRWLMAISLVGRQAGTHLAGLIGWTVAAAAVFLPDDA